MITISAHNNHPTSHRDRKRKRPPKLGVRPAAGGSSAGNSIELVLFKIFPLIMTTSLLISTTIMPSSSSSSPMPQSSVSGYHSSSSSSNNNNIIYNNGFQLYADQSSNNINNEVNNESLTHASVSTTLASSSSLSGPLSMSCLNGLLTFELSTGFIYKPASAETLAMMPSTLQLTDCLDYCLHNASCLAINFEVGLCVLLSSSAKQNPQNLYSSQFPVFTIYAEKKCLLQGDSQAIKQKHRCQRAWTFERVAGYEMKTRPRRRLKLASKEHCMEACLLERDFECRSANWYRQTNECTLSDQDRHSVSQTEAGDQQIKASLHELYGQSNLTSQSMRPITPPGLYQNYNPGDRLRLNSNETQTPPPTSGANATSASANSTTTSGAERTMVKRWARVLDSGQGANLAPITSNKYGRFRQLFSELQRMRGFQLQAANGNGPSKPAAATAGGSSKSSPSSTTTTQTPSEANNNQNLALNPALDLNSWPPSQYVVVELQSLAPVDYLENNCVYEPNKLCEFRKIQNRVLKTVDSIYQDVNSLEECKQKCLSAPYRCYSFDYGDTSERVCRTSHLDQASLLSVKEPYLDVVGAITYELASCFNVSIQCRAREMVAQVSSSKMFRGKIYVKSRPNSCLNDVKESLQFELTMRYHDENCDVRATSTSQQGVFSNDIVIQHHDRIVTTQDVGLSVYCQYDLGNRSITNNVDLAIDRIDEAPIESKNQPQLAGRPQGAANLAAGEGGSGSFNSPLTITSLATTVVKSPNVTMRITNMNGQPVASAMVGDRLALLFEIKEKTSPFGIFVREIIAMDGKQLLAAAAAANNNGQRASAANGDAANGGYHYGQTGNRSANGLPLNENTIESLFQANRANSVQFIDSDGCPTDANIMGPLIRMDPAGHRVLAPFDAFKFPTSDMVFFRAVVTSCVSECRPVVCQSAGGPMEPTPPTSPSGGSLNYVTTTTAALASTVSQAPTTSMGQQQQSSYPFGPGASSPADAGLGRHTSSAGFPSSYSGDQLLLPEVRATTPTPAAIKPRPSHWSGPTTVGQESRGKLNPSGGGSLMQPHSAAAAAGELHGTTPGGDSLTTIPGFSGGFPEQQTPTTWRQQQPLPTTEALPIAASNKTTSRPTQAAATVTQQATNLDGQQQEQVANPNNGENSSNGGNNNLAPINLDTTLSPQQRQQIVKLFETKLKQQLAPNGNSNNNNNGDISKSMADLYNGFLASIMLSQSGNKAASSGNSNGEQSSNNNNLMDANYNKRPQHETGGSRAGTTSGRLADFESLSSNSVMANEGRGGSFAGNNGFEGDAKERMADELEAVSMAAERRQQQQPPTKPINGIHSLKQQKDSLEITKPQSTLEQESGGDVATISHDPSDTEHLPSAAIDSTFDSHDNDLSQQVAPSATNGQSPAPGSLARQTFDRTNDPVAAVNPAPYYRAQQSSQQVDLATDVEQVKSLQTGQSAPTALASADVSPSQDSLGPRNRKQAVSGTSLLNAPDSRYGSFESYGRRRRRRQVDAELNEATSRAATEEDLSRPGGLYIFVSQPQESTYLANQSAVESSSRASKGGELPRFTGGFIELYRASEGPPRANSGRRKREAQPAYDVEELVVQSIKIMDRLQFSDDDQQQQQAHTSSARSTRGHRQNLLPKSQLVTRSQAGNQTTKSAAALYDESSFDGDQSARVGWPSSGALSLVAVAASFIFVQILLVLVCLIEYNQRRRSVALARQSQLKQQQLHSRRRAKPFTGSPEVGLSRCGSVSTLASSNTLFLGSSLPTHSPSSHSPAALNNELGQRQSPTIPYSALYHTNHHQISPTGPEARAAGPRALGRKEMESEQQQHYSRSGGGRQGKKSMGLVRSDAGAAASAAANTWGLLASNNDRQDSAAEAIDRAACVACRLPNSNNM